MALKATLIDPFTSYKAILLKSDNQRLIALAYNLVYHARTKDIDI